MYKQSRSPRVLNSSVTLLSLALVAVLGVACSSSSGSSAASGGGCGLPSGDIEFGAVMPLSGPLAQTGKTTQTSIDVAVKYFNAHSSICGHKIKVSEQDDRGDVSTGLVAVRKLMANKVSVFLQDGIGATQDAIHPLLMKDHALVLGPGGTPDKLAPATNPTAFGFLPTGPQHAVNMMNFAHARGFDQIGTLSDGGTYSAGIVAATRPAAAAAGLTYVTGVTFSPTALDVTTQLLQLKRAGVQTVFLTAVAGVDKVLAGLKQLHWQPHLLSWGALNQGGFTAADLPYSDVYDGCYDSYPAGQEKSLLTPAVTALLDSSVSAAGARPGAAIPLFFYAGLQVLKTAIESAHTTDGATLAKTIEKIGTFPTVIPGFSLKFSAANHAGYPTSSLRVCSLSKRGRYDILYALN